MQDSCHGSKRIKNSEIEVWPDSCVGGKWYFWQTVGLFAIRLDTEKACDLRPIVIAG
jgi:hypothetical protein